MKVGVPKETASGERRVALVPDSTKRLADAARGMRPGSVIVDLAAEAGGNCELTKPGETIEDSGVTIVGELNLPSSMPLHASQMYSRNVWTFLNHLLGGGSELVLDFEDEITRETCVAHEGRVLKEPVAA